VKEDQRKRGDICAASEKRHWNQWVLGQTPLAVDEGKDHDASNDEQSNDLGRVPWEQHPAKIEAKEDHEGKA
jgi:hypothetical protein